MIPAAAKNLRNIGYPVHSEIALTYRCQNRCVFCVRSAFLNRNDFDELTAPEVKTIIDKLYNDAEIPQISFTGGEPTIRKDLAEIIEYAAKKGMKTNLITNGVKCSDRELVKKLASSGLHSAMVSLESHDEFLHNRITGNIESYRKTIEGIHNLKEAGILTHTNTTICRENKEHLIPLVKFVKDEFNAAYLSMSMIIGRNPETAAVRYSSISAILEPVINYCAGNGIRFEWNTPTPLCMFNAANYNAGSRQCSCVLGLLSVNPAGEVVPCSGYNCVIGNLLENSFEEIWNSDDALYFRERKYIPTVCGKCKDKLLCAGGCPLYWKNAESFREIEKFKKRKSPGKKFVLSQKKQV